MKGRGRTTYPLYSAPELFGKSQIFIHLANSFKELQIINMICEHISNHILLIFEMF